MAIEGGEHGTIQCMKQKNLSVRLRASKTMEGERGERDSLKVEVVTKLCIYAGVDMRQMSLSREVELYEQLQTYRILHPELWLIGGAERARVKSWVMSTWLPSSASRAARLSEITYTGDSGSSRCRAITAGVECLNVDEER